uniref:Nucleotide-binding alpha-beta plait domain, zinc finger, RING/FYVE/PHD-type n=1 Tax=Tanacetum cinerariifolium TaxID=118510 RepID=A0A6L2MY46_TANCI|nr:nucleotide-binding alpha-beta plait domain, zinc finger, RING/FYVE/PHD-type [Tanacetum cinerariifolium]
MYKDSDRVTKHVKEARSYFTHLIKGDDTMVLKRLVAASLNLYAELGKPENATTSDKPLHSLLTDGDVTFKDERWCWIRAVSSTLDGVMKSFLDKATGSYMNNYLSNSHHRIPSIGNLSSSSDDLIDPSIMVVGRGKSSTFDMRFGSLDEGFDIPSSHMIEAIPTSVSTR